MPPGAVLPSLVRDPDRRHQAPWKSTGRGPKTGEKGEGEGRSSWSGATRGGGSCSGRSNGPRPTPRWSRPWRGNLKDIAQVARRGGRSTTHPATFGLAQPSADRPGLRGAIPRSRWPRSNVGQGRSANCSTSGPGGGARGSRVIDPRMLSMLGPGNRSTGGTSPLFPPAVVPGRHAPAVNGPGREAEGRARRRALAPRPARSTPWPTTTRSRGRSAELTSLRGRQGKTPAFVANDVKGQGRREVRARSAP